VTLARHLPQQGSGSEIREVPVVERGEYVRVIKSGIVLSFAAVTRSYQDGTPEVITLIAMEHAAPAGYLVWDNDSGLVLDLWVRDDRQRLGVASALWEMAQRTAEANGWHEPLHAGDRTEDGDAWARSLGGELPDRTEATDYAAFRASEAEWTPDD